MCTTTTAKRAPLSGTPLVTAEGASYWATQVDIDVCASYCQHNTKLYFSCLFCAVRLKFGTDV